MRKMIKSVMPYVFCFAFAMGIAILFTTFIAQRADVSGSSMEDTLHDGDVLVVNKTAYWFKNPERFDIIICTFEDGDAPIIKRVIGLPGETVKIDEDGNIYIDGELLDESYGKETIADPGVAAQEITLGEDEYFVMGDNRNNSIDSRSAMVGNITKDNIIGKAFVRITPNFTFLS